MGVFVLFSLTLGGFLILVQSQILSNTFYANSQEQRSLRINMALKELNQNLSTAESLTLTLADLATRYHNNTDYIKDIVPTLLDNPNYKDLIAGGGIWPEPYSWDKSQERMSLFWGRLPNGKLSFINEWNTPNTPSYYREEWYVPAKYIDKYTCYWSRSYIDPTYSMPMITCSVPYFHAGRLAGVVTVDVRLSGIAKIIESSLNNNTDYAFLLDRNNKFIYAPSRFDIQIHAANGVVTDMAHLANG